MSGTLLSEKGSSGKKMCFPDKSGRSVKSELPVLNWITSQFRAMWCLEQSHSHFKTKRHRKRGLEWQQSQCHWASEPVPIAAHVQTVQFSHSVVSDSLRPHGLQHVRPPCLSPTPGVYSNTCPLSQWCHPTISSSVVPFSCLQSFPASGSFPISQFFASRGRSIGVSASASDLPMNIQDWFPLGLTDLISLQSKGLSRFYSNTTVQKCQFIADWINNYLYKVL